MERKEIKTKIFEFLDDVYRTSKIDEFRKKVGIYCPRTFTQEGFLRTAALSHICYFFKIDRSEASIFLDEWTRINKEVQLEDLTEKEVAIMNKEMARLLTTLKRVWENVFPGREIEFKMVNEKDEAFIMLDNFFIITPVFVRAESIIDTYRELVWDMSYEKVVHGVRYYKDGSGEPDSIDIVDVRSYINTGKVIFQVVTFFAGMYASNMLEREAEEALAKEYEREENG